MMKKLLLAVLWLATTLSAAGPYYTDAGVTDPKTGIFYQWSPQQNATLETARLVAQEVANILKQKVDLVDLSATYGWFVPRRPQFHVRLAKGGLFNAGLLFRALNEQGGSYRENVLTELRGATEQPYNFVYQPVTSFGPQK